MGEERENLCGYTPIYNIAKNVVSGVFVNHGNIQHQAKLRATFKKRETEYRSRHLVRVEV